MKSFKNFSNKLNKLLMFYNLTINAYILTEKVAKMKKLDKVALLENFNIQITPVFPLKLPFNGQEKFQVRKNLCELVFVRLVTALEIFFIDLIKEAFLINKEPFKRQDISPSFTQAELLSVRSIAEVYNKIINRECRKLSGGGFLDIVKFYRKYFEVDMGNFSPGIEKMEEYHDIRHLLVHRLGNTDQTFRDKYKYSRHFLTVDNGYLMQCFKDFKCFSEMVCNQINYQLTSEILVKRRKGKIVERKERIVIEFPGIERPEFLNPEFEFWCDDELLILQDILDEKTEQGNRCELTISGKLRQIRLYTQNIRSYAKDNNVLIKTIEKTKFKEHKVPKEPTPPRVLDEEFLDTIKCKLPPQPWPTGIHKVIASEIKESNKIVSVAIQQLIARGIFKPQINGVIIGDILEK